MELKQRFVERGYPFTSLIKAYKRAKASNRTDLMHRKCKKTSNSQVTFITPYNVESNEMLQKHWDLLLMGDTLTGFASYSIHYLQKGLVNPQGMISNTKGPKWGCKKCGSYVACSNIVQTDTFWNSKTKEYKNNPHDYLQYKFCDILCHLPMSSDLCEINL